MISPDKAIKWMVGYILLALLISFNFALGWKFMGLVDSRGSELIQLAKCDPEAFVTVKFPNGGEYSCAPVSLPFPTRRPGRKG